MDRRLAKLLAECLDWIESGKGTVDQAVSRYPEYDKELRSLLGTIAHLENNLQAAPRQEFQAAARSRLLDRLEALPKTVKAEIQEKRPQIVLPAPYPMHRKFSMAWLMVLVLIGSFLFGGGGVVYAAVDALPGDTLYGVKTLIQDVELALSDDAGDIELLLGYMQENIDALNQLAQQERWDDLEAGLQQYQDNLAAMVQARLRVSYEEPPNEEALNERVQLELQTQTQELLRLQERLRDQARLQDKIQEAIQQTDLGYVNGPAEGGAPEDGVELQGTLDQNGNPTQQPDAAENPTNENGGQGDDAGQNGGPTDTQTPTSSSGEELEQDPSNGQQGGSDQSEGKGSGKGGSP